jgi:hypothetical protein
MQQLCVGIRSSIADTDRDFGSGKRHTAGRQQTRSGSMRALQQQAA